VTATSAPPRDLSLSHVTTVSDPVQKVRRPKLRPERLEGIVSFSLAFIAYFVAALLLAFKYHSFPEDAVSRMANGFYVLYSGDPHLASIGFVWNPLQSVADDVALIFNHLWPALASHDMAGSVVSVLSMAGAVYQLNATLREWSCPAAARVLLTLSFGLNPMILYYGANGMSEGLYLFTLMATTRYLLRWIRHGDLHSLVYAASFLGLCYLARNEAVGAAVLATPLIFVVSYLRELWMKEDDDHSTRLGRRSRSSTAFADAFIFGMPTIVAAVGWATTSWIITGQPFAQFTSIYGNSSQEQFLAHKNLDARASYEFHALIGLAPTLVVVLLLALIVGYRRRNLASLVPIAVFGGALLFDAGGYLTNTIENFLRYFITAIPLCALLVGSLFDRSKGWIARNPRTVSRQSPRQWSKWTIGIAATIVTALLIVPSLVTTTATMANPAIGVQESSLLGPIFHKHLTAGDRTLDATYPDIRTISAYLGDLKLPNGSIVVDNFTSCVPDIITNISQPKLFVIPNDRDFQKVVADPLTFHARFILEANPAQAPVTAVNISYPTLWKTGAGFTKLFHQIPARGDCPQFRLFRVVTHPSEAHTAG
jgi:hypothetical protein